MSNSVVAPRLSRAYGWYVLVLLTAINLFNYVDRMVPNGMFDDLRHRFHLSDGQLGALWTSFFTIHAITTIPFGLAADRWDRRKVLAFGVLVWSLATFGSAFAIGFWSLLFMRSLIGTGEAAYGPIANALLCDVFPPESKARTPIAIFNIGMFVGSTIGGAVGAMLGFPGAFLVVALPGIVLGVMTLWLKVPARRVEPVRPTVRPKTKAKRTSIKSMYIDAFRSIGAPTLRWMVVGGVLISFASGGYIAWFIDFITRYKGMTAKEASVVCGIITMVGGPAGVVAGGLIADRWQRRTKRGRILTIALGFFLATPFAVGAIYLPRGVAWYICSFGLIFFLPFYNGPMAAVIDDVVDDGEASTAQATFSFVLHLLGTGPGGFLVGFVSSRWSLQNAMLLPITGTLLAGVFCLLAARYVEQDMAARERRRALPSDDSAVAA